MATAALVGFAALRMLRPLVSPEDDRTAMIGQRTRVALEREKTLALRSIKELEFDRAMGRLSDEDWKEMSGRLRVRAARLIRQLDAGVGYREQIERELQKRIETRRWKAAPRSATRTARSLRARAVDAERGSAERLRRVRDGERQRREVLQGLRGEAVRTRRTGTVGTVRTVGVLCLVSSVSLVSSVRSRCGAQQGGFAMPDPKTDVGHPAAGRRSAEGRDLGPPDSRRAVEQHRRPPGRPARRRRKCITVKTDESGRAQFDDVPPGATVKATTEVDGERLESQEFPAPAAGGIRLMLVATDKAKAAAAAAAPAVTGEVVIGEQSRIVMQPREEAVERVLPARHRQQRARPGEHRRPFEFDMPGDAKGCGIMQGSSPQATVTGTHVAVQGPFAPGSTFVQVGVRAAGGRAAASTSSSGSRPRSSHLAVVVKKVGDTTLRSPQLKEQREVPADGEMFIAATGGAGGRRPADRARGRRRAASQPGAAPHRADAGARHRARRRVGRRAGRWKTATANAAERKRLIDAPRQAVQRAGPARSRIDRNGRVDDRRYAARREEIVGAARTDLQRPRQRRHRIAEPASPRRPATGALGA